MPSDVFMRLLYCVLRSCSDQSASGFRLCSTRKHTRMMLRTPKGLKGPQPATAFKPLPARPVRRFVRANQSGVQPSEQETAQAVVQQQQLQQQQAAPVGAPSYDPTSTAAYPGAYPGYGYPAQGVPQAGRAPQEYYMAPPPYYPPPAPYKAPEAASSGAPWWIWVGVGVVAANIFNKVAEFMRNPKSPQQMMTEMAMKQMMGAMAGSQGANSPFGKGGMPPFPAGFPPAASPSATVDVPASSPSPSSTSTSSSSERKGEKFASRFSSGQNGASSSTTTTSSGTAQDTSAKAAVTASAPSTSMDVVEPIVKEPPSSSSSSSGSGASSSSRSSRSASSFFADATAQEAKSSSSAGGSSSASAGSNGSAAGGEPSSVMSEMMESMLRNPEMQKMLYPYLPEPMRNPQSIEWMLNNPEVKKQMTQMFEQQNMMSPEMMSMMKNMDFSQDKVNQQFQELGLKPEDVITKVMSNPELAAGFQNPKVQAAIIDISSNPMNIVKYQQDPEIMKVLEQVTTLFQGDIASAGRR